MVVDEFISRGLSNIVKHDGGETKDADQTVYLPHYIRPTENIIEKQNKQKQLK